MNDQIFHFYTATILVLIGSGMMLDSLIKLVKYTTWLLKHKPKAVLRSYTYVYTLAGQFLTGGIILLVVALIVIAPFYK